MIFQNTIQYNITKQIYMNNIKKYLYIVLIDEMFPYFSSKGSFVYFMISICVKNAVH
jgi:hypothetical protein